MGIHDRAGAPGERTATRRHRGLMPFVAALLLAAVAAGVAPGAEALPVPCRTAGNRGVLVGAHHDPAPYAGMSTFTDLECEVGHLDVVHFYQAWSSTYSSYRSTWVDAAIAGGKDVMITWEPWAPGGGPNQPSVSLDAITNGAWDTYITNYATALRNHGRTVYLRPMHEMNGNWYPWSQGVNGNGAGDFVAAWRHIHDVFNAVGAHNVEWVWAPYVVDVPANNDLEAYWPGSAYVDVLGLDGYNWGSAHPETGGWLTFDQVFAAAYGRVAALGSQPIWFTEVGSAATGGDKAEWVWSMFHSTAFPRVDALVWFDMDKEEDWRMTSPAGVAEQFAFSHATTLGQPSTSEPGSTGPSDGPGPLPATPPWASTRSQPVAAPQDELPPVPTSPPVETAPAPPPAPAPSTAAPAPSPAPSSPVGVITSPQGEGSDPSPAVPGAPNEARVAGAHSSSTPVPRAELPSLLRPDAEAPPTGAGGAPWILFGLAPAMVIAGAAAQLVGRRLRRS